MKNAHRKCVELLSIKKLGRRQIPQKRLLRTLEIDKNISKIQNSLDDKRVEDDRSNLICH